MSLFILQNIYRKAFLLTSLTAQASLTSVVTHQRFYGAYLVV